MTRRKPKRAQYVTFNYEASDARRNYEAAPVRLGSLSGGLGRSGITVDRAALGFGGTDRTSSPEGIEVDAFHRRSALGFARAEDAASTISFLFSRDAEPITGTTLTVDGRATA
jgi:NAD(P)-dependent dehydrogenase (short-subunit alcohol dehydrogenase family)